MALVARILMPATSSAVLLPDPVATVDQARLLRLLGYRITRTELLVRRMFQDCVAAFDLKPVDFSLLMLVDGNPGINQRQIGDVLHVSAPNLAIVVARLVKRRLLRQVRGRQDRRMQHLSLTATGASLLAQAEAEVLGMEQQLSVVLGPSEAPLLRALDRLDRLDTLYPTTRAHRATARAVHHVSASPDCDPRSVVVALSIRAQGTGRWCPTTLSPHCPRRIGRSVRA